jgi:hypothetical protein
MTSNDDASNHYPVACPSCAGVKGYPFQVRTLSDRPGSIEVRLRCRDCHFEWVKVVASRD